VHVLLAPGAGAITTPLGKVSVNGAESVAIVLFGLVRVRVRRETPPAFMVAGVKDLPSVGGTGLVDGTAHTVTWLESIVTAPVEANALPEIVAPVVRVMLALAKIFPTNVVPTPSVAELPTCQNTLQFWAPLISSTVELLAVVKVLAILKTQTAPRLPPASRVTVPVNPADAAVKQ